MRLRFFVLMLLYKHCKNAVQQSKANMQKVTQAHATQVVTLLQQVVANYKEFATWCAQQADTTQADETMHANDIVYMQAACAAFATNKNASVLHDALMRQDTFVREYCISVLRYLEDAALIPRNMYACKYNNAVH